MASDLRCWAFNKDGVRCELHPGHPTLHTFAITWDDDECFAPRLRTSGVTQPPSEPATPMTGISDLPPLPEPMEPIAGCVGCNHKHKDGPCKCGCYEYIG